MKFNLRACMGMITVGLTSSYAIADDNIAACEIVIMRQAIESSQISTDASIPAGTPLVARFLPASDFIFSVFDETTPHLTEVDGQPIRAIMCTRNDVMLTEFDLQMIRTGISLHLSQNFDSPDSSLLSVRRQNGEYVHTYNGPEMSTGDQEFLKLRLEKLNQPAKEEEKVIVEENADH